MERENKHGKMQNAKKKMVNLGKGYLRALCIILATFLLA